MTIPDALLPVKMQRFIFFGALLILFVLYSSKGLLPAKNKHYDSEKKKEKNSQNNKFLVNVQIKDIKD